MTFLPVLLLAQSPKNLYPLLQNGFPSRDGSIVLRYIPDPTDKLLNSAFQPAPGKCPPTPKPHFFHIIHVTLTWLSEEGAI